MSSPVLCRLAGSAAASQAALPRLQPPPGTGKPVLYSSRGHCGKAVEDSQIIHVSTGEWAGWRIWASCLVALLLGAMPPGRGGAAGRVGGTHLSAKSGGKQTQTMKRRRFYPSPARQPVSLLRRISANVMRAVRAGRLAYTQAAILLLLAG